MINMKNCNIISSTLQVITTEFASQSSSFLNNIIENNLDIVSQIENLLENLMLIFDVDSAFGIQEGTLLV